MVHNSNPDVRDMVSLASQPASQILYLPCSIGIAMSTTNGASASCQYAFRLENNVWCVYCGGESANRSETLAHIIEHVLTPSIERIVNSAFEIVTRLNKEHFPSIVRHGSFADLTVCITDFCKVTKYQKISLLAIAMLRGIIPVMIELPECGLPSTSGEQAPAANDPMIKYWFPVLFGFYDVIMNGEDLEVRRL